HGDSPRRATDADAAHRAQRRSIDHTDIVRWTVGRIEPTSVLRQRDAPRPRPDLYLGDQLVGRGVYHCNGAAAARAHIEPLAARIEQDAHRARFLAQLHDTLDRFALRQGHAIHRGIELT